MLQALKNTVKSLLGITHPRNVFRTDRFQRINHRRTEHLESLRLPIRGASVLEVGAGIGDHTHFFLDRDCRVTTSDARPEHLKILKARYPDLRVTLLDLDNPPDSFQETFDILFCYGLLYHLKNPAGAIQFMARLTKKMVLVETRVSMDNLDHIHSQPESPQYPTDSVSGYCCEPSRQWFYDEFKKYFDFVYLPVTQPNHEEFPIDWSTPRADKTFSRAIFIASQEKLNNDLLVEGLPARQQQH